jgi:preprotein translocase subunit SecG
MSFQIILTIHVLIAIALVAIILMQQGKGADTGAAFGSGSAGSVFGASGATSFLYKLTRGLALGFFATSLLLAYIASSESKPEAATQDSLIQESDIPELPTSLNTKPLGDEDIPVIEK